MHNWIKLLCIICQFTYMIQCCVSLFAVDTRDKLNHLLFFNKPQKSLAILEENTVNLLLPNMCPSELSQIPITRYLM
jgi:hypothetical protein